MSWIKDDWTYKIEHMRLWADDYGRVYIAHAKDITEVNRALYLYMFQQGFLEYGEEWFTDEEILKFVHGPIFLAPLGNYSMLTIVPSTNPNAEIVWVAEI